MKRIRHRNAIAAAACLLAVVVAAPASAPKDQAEENWFAIFIENAKSGHARQERTVEEGQVTTVQEMNVTMRRGGMALAVRQTMTTVETVEGEPLRFTAEMDMGGMMRSTTEGRIRNGRLNLKITQAGQTRTRTMDWPEGALLAEGVRLRALKEGMEKGTTYTVKQFDPTTMAALESDVRVLGEKTLDLLGRRVTAHKLVTTTSNPMSGKITTTSYYDDEYSLLKSITPAMGIRIEILACSEEYARSPDNPKEFVRKLLVDAPPNLSARKLSAASSATYTLRSRNRKALQLEESSVQTVERGENGTYRLTVRQVKATGGAMPYRGDDKDVLAATEASRYLQADAEAIRKLAVQAVGDAETAAQAAANIEAFVHRYVQEKDLSVGYATALEVASSRQGDCTEHAVLAAALCRAAGLPAKVVTGLVYVDRFLGKSGVFGAHAWFRVYIDGKWVDYDAALDGWHVGHVAMQSGDGDPAAFLGLVGTLGNVDVTKASLGE